MPKRFSQITRLEFLRGTAAAALTLPFITRAALAGGGLTGGATEWTQMLNNGELISLVGKSAEQVNNQIKQINHLYPAASYDQFRECFKKLKQKSGQLVYDLGMLNK